MDLTSLPGQPSSASVRERLREAQRPVLLAFSRGKDSVAAWLALRESGVEVVPYHLYLVPHLAFVDDDLARWESFFGTKILNLPHPSLYRWLNNFTFQAPERLAIIEAAQLPSFTYEQLVDVIRDKTQMPEAWVCDGVRSADSPTRRLSMSTHGVMREQSRKCSPVWDWRKQHVTDCLTRNGAQLGPEYDWFSRSFDGLDRRFLTPLRDHAPADFQRILDWFPLADLDLTAVRCA